MTETLETWNTNLQKCKTTDSFASNLIVSVMTVCGSLGSPIDIISIANAPSISTEYTLNYVPNTKKTQGQTKVKAFYNCLNVTWTYGPGKIAAKVFPNGSIQIPGCRTFDAVNKVPEILYGIIQEIANSIPGKTVIKDIDNFKLRDVRIVMINSNFKFHGAILQESIKNIINEDQSGIWRMASFQPERHSGVNIRYLSKRCREIWENAEKLPLKLDGQVSIFIFRSGKSTIAGAKNTTDLAEAYEAIVDIVRRNKDQIIYKEYV